MAHLHTGEIKFRGTNGPVWMQTTLCHKLLKTMASVTKDRNKVRCPECLAAMRKADAFMRWLETGSAEDFVAAHGSAGRR